MLKVSSKVTIKNTKTKLVKDVDLRKFTVEQQLKLVQFYCEHETFEIIFKQTKESLC